MKPTVKRIGPVWPDYHQVWEADRNETQELVWLVEDAWEFSWPGWSFVATRLNMDYGNNRTPRACMRKYWRLSKSGALRPNRTSVEGLE